MLVIFPLTNSMGGYKEYNSVPPSPIVQRHDTWCSFAVFEMLRIHPDQCRSATEYMMWRDQTEGHGGMINWDCCYTHFPCEPMLLNYLIPFYNHEAGWSYTHWVNTEMVFNTQGTTEPLPRFGIINVSNSTVHAVCLYQVDIYRRDALNYTTVTASYVDPWYGNYGQKIDSGYEPNPISSVLIMARF